MNSVIPKVFISYSWEDDVHKNWVKEFAIKLQEEGIQISIDQWDLTLGDQLPQYMETSIRENDFVLIICTPEYKKKSDNRLGGVGYEGDIITGELFVQQNKNKFIPVLRKGNWETAAPSWLQGRLGVDLLGDQYLKNGYNNLVTTLLNKKNKKPTTKKVAKSVSEGTAPGYDVLDIEKAIVETYVDIKIKGILVDKVTLPKMNGTRGSALYKIPFKLSDYPSGMWCKFFISAWVSPSSFTTMHRPDIAGIFGDEIILDGTTIEEVEKYHHKTLLLAVDKANELEKYRLQCLDDEKKKKARLEADHIENIQNIASRIIFD
ncbi:toll/interleukin-1 receptor domain-containing protein [Acetobacterium bakii]|uniref:Uncharacterized protein n=1 Tax=Acetobacterium bakii TaxID=52689 RepID=A0A0L6U024_9FIRM|nr:toll/interleukin-1 receptor domain-containing protein [Acetobacterium bakii]KNZ41851.1 hypothetical protein AKG39_09535 [Acetobacterium bakii]